MVEVAGVEPATPNGLQYYDIINYYYNTILSNGTGIMVQVSPIKFQFLTSLTAQYHLQTKKDISLKF